MASLPPHGQVIDLTGSSDDEYAPAGLSAASRPKDRPLPLISHDTINNSQYSGLNHSMAQHGATAGPAAVSSTPDSRLASADYDLKRQRALENKMSLLKRPALGTPDAKSDAQRAIEKQHTMLMTKIDSMLERIGYLDTLPTKYQVQVPEMIYVKESTSDIRGFTTPQEEIHDLKLPTTIKAAYFRPKLREVMNDVCHRISQIRRLYITVNKVMNSAKLVLNEINSKINNSLTKKKLLIRYGQIKRFLKLSLNHLHLNNENLGKIFDNLTKFKKQIHQLVQSMEKIRQSVIITNQFNGVPTINYEIFRRNSYELETINNTVNSLFKLSDPNSPNKYKLLRESTSPSSPLPPFEKANLPNMFNNPYSSDLMSRSHLNPLSDDDDAAASPYDIYQMHKSSSSYNSSYSTYSRSETEDLQKLMESMQDEEIPEEGLANTPDELVINLMKHQRIGLSWLLKMEQSTNKGGILADDMGLGKTVQALALILANKPPETDDDEPSPRVNLIVGPVSLLNQWKSEFKIKVKSSNQLKTYLFHGQNKISKFDDFNQYDVVFVSYSTLASEYKKHYAKELADSGKTISDSLIKLNYKSPFFTSNSMFYRIILDEAQNIKNKSSQASMATSLLRSKYKWCLSGTPIQNSIDELYPLIRFLNIGPYNDWSKFKNSISIPIKNKSSSASRKIHVLLKAILLRRTKDSKIDDKPILQLPEKFVNEKFIELTDDDKLFYETLEQKSAKVANKLMNNNVQSKRIYSSILTLLLRMRQACDHEYLVKMGDFGNRSELLDRYTKGWESLNQLNDSSKSAIEVQRDEGLMCIRCSEDLDDNHCLILSKCGHVMCKDCHTSHFEEELTDFESNPALKSAKCLKCKVENFEQLSIDFVLYKCYFDEGLSWQEVRKKFDLNSQASNINWRKDIIDKLIENEDTKQLKISGKIIKTLEIIQKIQGDNPNDKIIIFSQFIGFFEIIGRVFREKSIEFLQYDGSMNIQQKNDTIKEFYQSSTKKILLLSLKAGNVGLTLTCANHVIILEPFWNPYVEKQAQDRVHRISQIKEVHIYRLLVKNTVEDRIMELQKQKEEMVESALDPNARKQVAQLSRRELGFLFGLNGLAGLENDQLEPAP